MNQIQHLPYTFNEKNSRFRLYEQKWKDVTIEELKKLYPDGRVDVLDFGSGRGELSKALVENGFNVIAVDADAECVKLTQKYCQTYLINNIKEFRESIPDNSVDIVVALHVLEHLKNPIEYIEEFKRVSRDYLILGVPNPAALHRVSFRKIKSVNIGHLQCWDFQTFENMLVNHCNLDIIKFIPDLVSVPKISNLLHKLKIRKFIEENMLVKIMKYQSNSIIALCKLNKIK